MTAPTQERFRIPLRLRHALWAEDLASAKIYRPEGPSLRVDVAACLLVSDRMRERASICLQAIFLVPEYEPFT
jgi:hypothetical protein